MVDFQSRDTSRGVDEGDAAETDHKAETPDADGAHTAAAPDEEGARDGADAEDESAAGSIAVAILVADGEGEAAADAVADAVDDDHEVLGRDRRTDDLDAVQSAVNTFIDQSAVDAVVTVGGVDVGLTQVTVEAVEPLLDAKLPGFGELFRREYERTAGSAAVRSRAFAGVAGTTPVFCLPSDADAAAAAAEDLIAPELDGLVDATAVD